MADRHRFWCPLTRRFLPDDARHHAESACTHAWLTELHGIYVFAGGMAAAAQLEILPNGPFEVVWTRWGPIPIPCAREPGPAGLAAERPP